MQKQKSVNNVVWFFTVLIVALIAGFVAIQLGWAQFQLPVMKLAAALAMLIAIRANLANGQNWMAGAWWAAWLGMLGWLTDEVLPKFGPELTTFAVGAGIGFLLSIGVVLSVIRKANPGSPKKGKSPDQIPGDSSPKGPKTTRKDELHMTIGGLPGRGEALDVGAHEQELASSASLHAKAAHSQGIAAELQAKKESAQLLIELVKNGVADHADASRIIAALLGLPTANLSHLSPPSADTEDNKVIVNDWPTEVNVICSEEA